MVLSIMFFLIEFFLTIAFYQFSKNDLIYRNHDLFFQKKYSLQLYYFQFSESVNNLQI